MSLHVVRCVTKAFIRAFEDQLLRMAMGKAANVIFQPGVHTGKLTEDKVKTITDAWVRYVCRSLPGIDVAGQCRYIFTDGGDQAPKADEASTERLQLEIVVY